MKFDKYSPARQRSVAADSVQMFDAVTYLHASSIVHRDISVDKFLLDSRDRVKLSNFASAMTYSAGQSLFTSRQATQIHIDSAFLYL